MTRFTAVAMAAFLVGLLPGCTPHCRGDLCARPASSTSTLVIWWPPHMRLDTGPNAEGSDHQIVPLER
ncbi:HrpT family type III secretion system protein [Pseudomonas bubulae]|uniref:HrpT family type III secretion system protein n=2 Tax=Pseudomonas bubulae TaxID=2316085 RepID=UPI00399CDB65